MKTCSECTTVKPNTDFYKGKDVCKTCKPYKYKKLDGFLGQLSRVMTYRAGTHAIPTDRRQQDIKKATPKWADINAINRFIKNRPRGMCIDHDIPLRGSNCGRRTKRTVCGLHVLENLQYITIEENCSKGIKYNTLGDYYYGERKLVVNK